MGVGHALVSPSDRVECVSLVVFGPIIGTSDDSDVMMLDVFFWLFFSCDIETDEDADTDHEQPESDPGQIQ